MKPRVPLHYSRRVILSTLISVAIVALANLVFNWIWVLNHKPDEGETILEYYMRCVILSSFVICVQYAVLMLLAGIVGSIRKQYRFFAGICSGLLLYAASLVAPVFDLVPGHPIGMLLYFLIFPLLSLGLQWWPRSRTRIIEPGSCGYVSPRRVDAPHR